MGPHFHIKKLCKQAGYRVFSFLGDELGADLFRIINRLISVIKINDKKKHMIYHMLSYNSFDVFYFDLLDVIKIICPILRLLIDEFDISALPCSICIIKLIF